MATDKDNMDAWKAWAAKQPKNKEAIKKETSKKKKKTTTTSESKPKVEKKKEVKKKEQPKYKKNSTRDILSGNKRKRQMEALGI